MLSALPVRWRLALFNSLVLAAVLALSGALVWAALTERLQSQLDDSLQAKSVDVAKWAVSQPALPSVVFLPDVANFTSADTFLQVVSTDGRVIDRSPNLAQQSLPWTWQSLSDAAHGTASFTTRTVAGGRLRVYTTPLQLDGRTVAVLQVARSTESVDETRRLLALTLLGSEAGGLILSLVLGWWLAGLALAP